MRTDRSTTAFQGLIGDMRNYWAKDLYPAFAAHCRDRLGRDRLADKPADSPDAIAGEMRDDTLYAYYAWLERHIQRMKYSHPAYGLKAAYGRLRPEIAAHLDGAAAAAGGMLELAPDLEIPQYYRDVDIHQHPGNLAGDIIDGYVYQASALSIHPNTKRFEVHDRFAGLVRARGVFRRILDMGCGFGKSTTPLAREFPDARVLGIELSAPCLKLAAVEGVELQLRNLAYRQADCLRSALADESFDLVTSTQLLHELPVTEIHNVLAESFRLLQPGGQVLHLDFRSQGAFQGFLTAGHARRNNEGFMAAFDRMDVAAAFARAGFTDYQEIPFAEREGATDPDYPYWRFPWMLFAARKP
ncbi:MAG: class I SAM-dependent methyltransferase [Sneathiellaceae bacterium]